MHGEPRIVPAGGAIRLPECDVAAQAHPLYHEPQLLAVRKWQRVDGMCVLCNPSSCA